MVRGTTLVLQAVEEALKGASLPALSWYDLLLELRRAGPDGLRPVTLQREMLIPQYNMSRLLDRVEAAGYVQRVACDNDGRGQMVRITRSGEDLLKQMWPVYRQALSNTFAREIDEATAKAISAALSAFGPRQK